MERKIKKPGTADTRRSKHCCGTLNYLAECRGTLKKADAIRRESPPDGVNRFVRKYPAVV